MPQHQLRSSLEKFLIPVDLLITEGANPDTSLDVVQFQFIYGGLPPRSQPVEGDWVDGFWITSEVGTLLAGILVGPGGTVTLEKGVYAACMRIIDNPTVPVKAPDTLTIT